MAVYKTSDSLIRPIRRNGVLQFQSALNQNMLTFLIAMTDG